MEGASSRNARSRRTPSDEEAFRKFTEQFDIQVQKVQKTLSDPIMIDLEGYVMSSRHGEDRCKEIVVDGIKTVVRFLPKGSRPAKLMDLENSNILTPLRILYNQSSCALMYMDFYMTIDWYIKSKPIMKIEFEDKLSGEKRFGFSERMKTILREIIEIIIWLHENGYTHNNLSSEDIVIFKTVNKRRRKTFFPKLTNSLEKHNLRTNTGFTKFEKSCNSNWTQLCRIVQKMVHTVGNVFNEEIQDLFQLLLSDNLAIKRKANLIRDCPALWSPRYRLDFIKLLYVQTDNGTFPLPGLYNKSWQSHFPPDVIRKSELEMAPRSQRITSYKHRDEDFIRFIRNICEHDDQFLETELIRGVNLSLTYSDMSVWIRHKTPGIYVYLRKIWNDHLEPKSAYNNASIQFLGLKI